MANDALSKWRSDFLSLSPRRKTLNFLLDPARQLRVPFYSFMITLTFGAAWLWSLAGAFGDFYRKVIAEQPASLEAMILSQTQDLVLLTGLMAVGYVAVLFGTAIVVSHRYVGPRVPLLRQIQALEDGDYSARVRLRRNDYLTDLADALNRLAETLEDRREQDAEKSLQ